MTSASPVDIPIIDPPAVAGSSVPAKPAQSHPHQQRSQGPSRQRQSRASRETMRTTKPLMKKTTMTNRRPLKANLAVIGSLGRNVKRTGPKSCAVSSEPDDRKCTSEEYRKLEQGKASSAVKVSNRSSSFPCSPFRQFADCLLP